MRTTYTHPDVLTVGVVQGWADPETDPTRIDWPARQRNAAIPFEVIDGRPINPVEPIPGPVVHACSCPGCSCCGGSGSVGGRTCSACRGTGKCSHGGGR